MIKAVMFDLDNTLYSFSNAEREALKKVYGLFRKYKKIKFAEFEELFKLAREEVKKELAGTFSAHSRMLYFKRLVEKTHSDIDFFLILKLRELYWKTFLKSMKVGKDTLTAIKGLKKRGIKVGIVSNGPTEIQIRKLVKLKIERYVDEIVTSQETGTEKPNHSMFLLALNRLDCLAEESLMVGDNPVFDAGGANVLNISTVLITEHSMKAIPEFSSQKPDYVIKRLRDLDGVIEKENSVLGN